MNQVSEDVEMYGSVTISAPLLVPVEKASDFEFDLDKSAEFYFDAARVEGAIRVVRQRSIDVQLAMKIQIDQLLKTLAEMKAARSSQDRDELQQVLTKQLLSVAALNEAAQGAAGADAIAGNPLLKVGLDALLAGVGGGEAAALGVLFSAANAASEPPAQNASTGPEDVVDEAAPPQTTSEALAEGGTANGDSGGPVADAGEGDADAPPEYKSLLPLKRPAQEVLTSKQFSEPLKAFDGPVSISPRQAISLAANDKMTQDLFKWFASPKGFGSEKKAYLCMLTVSCQPGYRVRSGFKADVFVTTEYARPRDAAASRKSARPAVSAFTAGGHGSHVQGTHEMVYSSELLDDSGKRRLVDNFTRPLVSAVYPMVDSQVLDLRQSVRDQIASALSIALLFPGTQVDALADYVERFESDAQTQTAFTVGSAYSAGGHNFGFRIEPRFIALQPGQRQGIAEGEQYRIESTQFPAMVLVFAEKADLAASVGGNAKEDGYDHIVFHSEGRWLARDRWNSRIWGQSESDILERARKLDRLRSSINAKLRSAQPDDELYNSTLRRRRQMLAAAGLGSTTLMELPRDEKQKLKEPKVSMLANNQGWLNAVTHLLVKGENFSDKTIHGAVVGGRPCSVVVVNEKTVVVAIDAWGENSPRGPMDVQLVSSIGPLSAGNVDFVRKYEAVTPKARPSVKVDRNANGDILGIQIMGDFSNASRLLELIRNSLICCEYEHSICIGCGACGHGTPPCGCKDKHSTDNHDGTGSDSTD